MKKITLLACCFAMSLSTTYAQSNTEKQYHFLRDYKAPDFKQKRFDIGFNLFGSGVTGDIKLHSFNERSNFNYSQYANSAKYQGSLNVGLLTDISLYKNEDFKDFRMDYETVLNTQNRFFFNKEWFIGFHNRLGIGYESENDSNPGGKTTELSVSTVPALSIGNGRLEPVIYARSAMDIEKSLTKGGRLSSGYSEGQLKMIADELARINNVRFYDFRLRRIEQFEALDKLMKEVGGVSDFDMVYFSHLSDAYLYAQSFTRYSGFRTEIGIVNKTDIHLWNPNDVLYQRYNISGFANVIYDLPKTYAVQHTFSAGAMGGPELIENNGIAVSTTPMWLTGEYRLGLFPTTRTNLNFGVKTGMYYEEEVGAALGFYSNGNIYLSPQFRLSFNAGVKWGENYVEHEVGGIIPSVYNSYDGLTFRGGISLNYAIF